MSAVMGTNPTIDTVQDKIDKQSKAGNIIQQNRQSLIIVTAATSHSILI